MCRLISASTSFGGRYSGSRTRFRISASILSRGTLPASCDSLQRSKACRGFGFFPGSTVGNLLVAAAVDLLRSMAATLGAGTMLLIGIDRLKDADVLLPAYDDA